MPLRNLSESERRIVLQCMLAVRDGPFLHHNAFHARLAVTRDELMGLIDRWPDIDDTVPRSKERLAVNHCMATALNTYAVKDSEWPRWFDVTRDEVKRIYDKWSK